MRILLVSYRFPPDTVGGLERYTESLAAELVKAGNAVTIVARRTEPGKASIRRVTERLPDGTAVHRIIGPDVRFDRFMEHREQFDRMFTTSLLESQPDIVHINHLLGFSPEIAQVSGRLGAAVVLSLHDFYFACPRIHLRKTSGEVCRGSNYGRECAATCFSQSFRDPITLWRLRALYFARTLATAQAIIAYSEYVARYFEYFTAGTKSIHVIPNGVPVELARAETLRSNHARVEALTLAYCGTVAAHKGPHVILEAARTARLNSVNVRLIGHAPERDYVKQLVELAETIPGVKLRLYDKYERRDLPLLLADADCVIVPSLVPEAGPIVPREALACGVPVIASRIGALPEVISEGENGFTFEAGQAQDLADILRRLARNPSLRARLREGATNSPVTTVYEHARRVCDVYDRALRDFHTNPIDRQDASELKFLHEALLRQGASR